MRHVTAILFVLSLGSHTLHAQAVVPGARVRITSHQDSLISRVGEAEKIYTEGVTVKFGKVSFNSATELTLNGETFNSRNTLIATGNGNRVIEVNPDGKVVWSIGHDELPGIRLAWVTTLQLLPNGNLIVGNCHGGPDNPQLFEVTRDKKVVWTFKDFKTFGNSLAAAQVLDIKGKVSR